MAPPSLYTQIVIDSTNKWIPLIVAPGGIPVDRTTSIPEATYEDISAVVAAVQVAIRAVGGGLIIPNADVTITINGAIPGLIEFDYSADLGAGDTVEMDWFNNAHGENNADDHIGTILGFDDSADDGPIGTPWAFTSDWQHQHGWYAERAIRSYGPYTANLVGGEFRMALSRAYAKQLYVGSEHEYVVMLEQLPPWHVFSWDATLANTNRALISETVWGPMVWGQQFKWREDYSIPGTYTIFYLKGPRNLSGNLHRKYPDHECYDLTMTFLLRN